MNGWSDPLAYVYTERLSARDWAWEFLRRNPEFRVAWERSTHSGHGLEDHPHICMAISSDPCLRDWGILFRGSPGCCCATCPCHVGSGSMFHGMPGNGRAG
jgi:hypothetical protein